MLQRLLRALRSPLVRGGFLLLALGFAAWAVAREREAVAGALARLDTGSAALALLLSVLNVALAGASWRAVVADLGSPLPWRSAAAVFFVGQLGRYVPGSVWQFLAQAELGRDHGVPRRRTATALAVSLLVSMTTAALLVLLALPEALRRSGSGAEAVPGWVSWLPWAAPLLVVLLLPRVLNPLLRACLRLVRQEPPEHDLSARGVVAAAGWALASWLAVGGQVFVLARAAVPAAGEAGLLGLSVGGYALAWVVGFVVVFAPAGAGAREAALVAVLSAALTGGGALVVALLSRVLLTVADLLLAASSLLAVRRAAR
ncbi:hypothetical protein NUM3379_29260 [Kineococcus sp. NUM-3379]